MVNFFCHRMSLRVCPGENLFLKTFWPFFEEKNCLFGFLVVMFYCGAVALSASFFLFDVLDGRC